MIASPDPLLTSTRRAVGAAARWLSLWHAKYYCGSPEMTRRECEASTGMDEAEIKSVLDRFWMLSPEDRIGFVRSLGKGLTAELAYTMLARMETVEFSRFIDMMVDETWRSILPSMVTAAIRIVREKPDLSGTDLEEAVLRFHQSEMALIGRDIRDTEVAVFKRGRNRKSSPETIRRNLEICNLRKQNPRLWSHGKLAKKFGVTDRAIRSILKHEGKWRDLSLRVRTE